MTETTAEEKSLPHQLGLSLLEPLESFFKM